MTPIEQSLRGERLIAILRGDFARREVLDIAEVLLDRGIRAIEYTWNSPNAAAIVHSLKEQFGTDILVGAGTVLTVDQYAEARAAGAEYVITPHWSPEISEIARREEQLLLPGVLTPSEVHAASQDGWRLQKLFPALLGGVEYLKALRGPFHEVDFIPTGGVNGDNARAFFSAGAAAIGVGSWLAHPGVDVRELSDKAGKLLHSAKRSRS